MEKQQQDALVRAYTALSSLRKNIAQIAHSIPEVYVTEFHKVLERLEHIGVEVSEFRVPESLVKPMITSAPVANSSGVRGRATYSEERYVDKPFILHKLDSILGYFEFVTSETPKRIGFRKANEQ